MTFRGNYIPKRKKVNYKRVVPFIIVLAIFIGYIVGNTLIPEKEVKLPGYSFCNMNDFESQNVVTKNNNENAIAISDYSIYGDSLSFYDSAYSATATNSKISNSIILTNICDSTSEDAYFLDKSLDNQIPLGTLKPGFYELRVYEGFERKRISSETKLDFTIKTSSKNGEVNEVRVLADSDLFNVEGLPKLDKNYVFLEVKKGNADKNTYDIVLDPNGLYDDGSGYIYPGLVLDNYHEANDMHQLVKSVQTELTSRGYKVALSRDLKQPVSIHGENGRIHNAYKMNAKYYVHFTMLFDTRPSTSGATVIYSNFSSSKFAEIMKAKINESGLPLYDFGNGTIGIAKTGLFEGLDYNAILRETGGRYTGAGSVNDRYKQLNAFAQGNDKAMQSLIIELGYASNPETLKTLKDNYDGIVKSLADGLEMQLNQE